MNQLELQNAKKIIEKFEELQEEFNNKYEDDLVFIGDNGQLNISSLDYFGLEDTDWYKEIIIDYKKIISD